MTKEEFWNRAKGIYVFPVSFCNQTTAFKALTSPNLRQTQNPLREWIFCSVTKTGVYSFDSNQSPSFNLHLGVISEFLLSRVAAFVWQVTLRRTLPFWKHCWVTVSRSYLGKLTTGSEIKNEQSFLHTYTHTGWREYFKTKIITHMIDQYSEQIVLLWTVFRQDLYSDD